MKKVIYSLALAVITIIALSSCSHRQSYADLLNSETRYVNAFLADNKVINSVPADTVFEVGPNAPYYRLDDEGNVYMQVLYAGTKGDKADYNDQIFFRFMRYNLYNYTDGKLEGGSGNAEDFSYPSTSFRFNNFSMPSSSQWGSAIQMPLFYLPVDCEVNLVVKSQYGISDEIANVIPYLYKVRYYRPQI